ARSTSAAARMRSHAVSRAPATANSPTAIAAPTYCARPEPTNSTGAGTRPTRSPRTLERYRSRARDDGARQPPPCAPQAADGPRTRRARGGPGARGGRLVGQPLTEPAIIPRTKYRWSARNTMTGTIIEMKARSEEHTSELQ